MPPESTWEQFYVSFEKFQVRADVGPRVRLLTPLPGLSKWILQGSLPAFEPRATAAMPPRQVSASSPLCLRSEWRNSDVEFR